MTHTLRTSSTFRKGLLTASLAFATLALVACGPPTTTVHGRVSDETGTQRQGLSIVPPEEVSFGGEGSATAATSVSAWTVESNGSLRWLQDAAVRADGQYTVELRPDVDRVVLIAVDGEGRGVASVLLDRAGGEGEEVTAAPMSAETTLEAKVFAQMAEQGAAPSEVDTVSLRALIDARTAEAVKAREDAGEATEESVGALAEAARVAQESRLRAYARAGVNVTAQALFEAQVEASAQLDAALHQGEEAQAAYARFYESLEAAREKLGAQAEERADGERAASAGFRGTLQVRLGGQADTEPVLTAAVKAAALQEARAQEAAARAAVATAAQAEAAQARIEQAFGSLRTEVRAAAGAQAAAAAYARFSAALATDANLEATALGAQLGVAATNRMTVEAAVAATVQASATLDAALQASFDAVADAPRVPAETVAQQIVDAYAAFSSAVEGQATTLAAFGPRAEGAVDLLVIAEGSFSGSN